jgi:hypothetical protein
MEKEYPDNNEEGKFEEKEPLSSDQFKKEEASEIIEDEVLEGEKSETEEINDVSPTKPSTDTHLEDIEVEQSESVVEEPLASKKMPGWLRKGLLFLIFGLLLILAGYLISFFTATSPLQKSYQFVLSELSIKESEVDNLQNQYDQTRNDLLETQNNLLKLEGQFQGLQQEHDQLLLNSDYNSSFINFKYEIGLARLALLNEDTISSRQAVTLAKEHFEKIRNSLDADISSGIDDQLQEIQRLVRSDTEQAIDKLRTLSENLERIPLK